MKTYRVFVRNWWKKNKNWPGGSEPSPGRKTTIAKNLTRREAQRRAMEYNKTHEPGFLSRKAEFEEM